MGTVNMVCGYSIGRTLGVGTFGKVKLGIHEETGIRVAIKIISKSQVMTMGSLNKLSREIGSMKELSHPNIVNVIEVIDTPTVVFIIMEYIQGELFDYISQTHRLDEAEARRVLGQILAAVNYCHSKMLCHRDLKPENIMLDHKMNVKLGDFGLSNFMRDGECLRTPCGSPNYASPEVICGKYYAGPEVDIWSCGIILYVLLCGTLPFDDAEMPALFRKIRLGKFHIPGHVTPQGKALLLRMLDVNPQTRITMRELWAHPWFSCYAIGHVAIKNCNCNNPSQPNKAFGIDAVRGLEAHYTTDVYNPHNAKEELVSRVTFSLNRSLPRWTLGVCGLDSEEVCVNKICAVLKKLGYKWRFLHDYKIMCQGEDQSPEQVPFYNFVIQLYKLKHRFYIVDVQLCTSSIFPCLWKAVEIIQHIASI